MGRPRLGGGQGPILTSLRKSVFVLGTASLVAGCPAFVYDPPYRAVEGDAAVENHSDATANTGPVRGDDAATSDGLSDATSASPDGGPPDAATGDAAGPFDAGCAGVICNGACLTGVTDCSGCAGMQSLCLATRTCQSDCAGCGSGVSCLMCADGGSPADAAIACGDGCLAGAYPHCGCMIASTCAAANQTCTNGVCTACGEPSTDRQACPGKCSPASRSETCFETTSTCTCN
jgi:hypothetical protein